MNADNFEMCIGNWHSMGFCLIHFIYFGGDGWHRRPFNIQRVHSRVVIRIGIVCMQRRAVISFQSFLFIILPINSYLSKRRSDHTYGLAYTRNTRATMAPIVCRIFFSLLPRYRCTRVAFTVTRVERQHNATCQKLKILTMKMLKFIRQ